MGNESDSETQKDEKESKDYITFERVQETLNLSNPKLFKKYLHEVFLDLSSLPDSKNNKYISNLTFYDYLRLPIFISEKLFNSFKRHCKGGLLESEFVNGFYQLYMGTFEETTKRIFNLLDFDKDEAIQKEDVKLILIYLLLDDFNPNNNSAVDNENDEEIYLKQMKKMKEIDELINKSFKKDNMNINEFISCLKKNKSDIYLQILCFLYSKKPFNEKSVEYLKLKYMNDEEYEETANIYIKKRKSSKNLIRNPRKGNELINKVIKKNEYCLSPKRNTKTLDDMNFPITKFESTPIKLHHRYESFEAKNKDIFKYKKEKNDNLISNQNVYDNNNICYENSIFKISENNKITEYHLVLINKDIYYYKNHEKKELIGMHNLSSCFVKEYENKGERVIDNIPYYCFSLIFKSNSKVRKYFTPEIEIYNKFVSYLKIAIGHSNFEDYYEIQKEIGVGRNSHVNLGVQKQTGKLVTIKIIKKTKESKNEEELVLNEINILKFCHHKNIVHLIDYFETIENIIIVLQYIEGCTLGDYLKEKNFSLTEAEAANIMLQIANGIKYLQLFGIIHRDLKPDNIMISQKGSDINVKIVDFGLSKIVSSEETLKEGFGTLYYAAPELIQNLPYNKEIDIWSLGIILFYIFTSCYPFMGKEEDEIEEKIINDPVEFKDGEWKNISDKVPNLIKKCLKKSPEERITINNFIDHPWFKILLK